MRHITMKSRWETDDEAQKPPDEDDRPKCPECKIPLRKKGPVSWSCFLCEKEYRTTDLLNMQEREEIEEEEEDLEEDEEPSGDDFEMDEGEDEEGDKGASDDDFEMDDGEDEGLVVDEEPSDDDFEMDDGEDEDLAVDEEPSDDDFEMDDGEEGDDADVEIVEDIEDSDDDFEMEEDEGDDEVSDGDEAPAVKGGYEVIFDDDVSEEEYEEISCRCGNTLKIPTDERPYRFKCSDCGRSGLIESDDFDDEDFEI